MFSWFATSTIVIGENRVRDPGKRQVDPKSVLDTLALAILIANPALNRKREFLPNGFEAQQQKSPHPHTIRSYLKEILTRLPPGGH